MDLRSIEKIVKEAMSVGKKNLTEPEAKNVLSLGDIPVGQFRLVKDVRGAVEAAQEIGYPVALKVVSPDIVHKSDVGGVVVGLKNAFDIEAAWAQMLYTVSDERATASIEGFLIEKEAPPALEVIVGAIKDEQFGPVVMFGVGGVAVELMRDVSFRLAPLTREQALEMMREVRGFPLLNGYRGAVRRDVRAVANAIVRLSEILEQADGIKEIEINPLFVYENGVLAVDARAVLDGPKAQP